MEIQENTVLKSFKQNLEISVDKILNKHSELSEETEIPEDEFEDIVEKIIKSKEISSITQKFYEYSEIEQNNFLKHFNKTDLYDDDKLDNILMQLVQSKTSECRVNGLNSLLNYSVLDLVETKKWPKLSKILRECLMSKSREVFSIALKIHIKISNHPHTIIDGSLNLVKTITSFIHSKKLQAYSVSIDLRIRLQEQIIKILYLLLNNFTQIFKNFNTGRDKQIEEIIYIFLDLQTIDPSWDKYDYINITYYIAVLDPFAKWFKHLLFTLQYRKVVIAYLLKNPSFTRFVIKEFMCCLSFDCDINKKKGLSKEITYEIIKFASLSSCANIISTLISYSWCQKLFPIEWKINEQKMTQTGIVSTIISAIQCLNHVSRRKFKRDILCDAIKIILTKNTYLLYKKDILHLLIKPFLLKIDDRHRLSEICRTNLYVIHIINEIANTQDGVFIIFGFMPEYYGKKRNENQYIRSITLEEPLVISTFIEKYKRHHRLTSEREVLSLAKIICEFTTNFIRHQINLQEAMSVVDDMVYELFECCCNIHALHSHVMYLVNSQRLVEASLQFYKILIDRNLLLNTMNPLLKFLITVCSTVTGTECFIQQDSESLYILCKHHFFLLDDNLRYQKNFSLFFANLSNTVPGCIAIAECRRQIVTPFLNRIWKLEEDQMLYLSGSDRLVEEEIFKYLRFIYVLQFNFKCVHALLTNEEDDESTLVDTEQKPSSLKDLLDETLTTTGPGTLSCYVGLCTLKLLITNLDTLLYLEETANLQVELEQLQSQCTVQSEIEKASSEATLIIDECSLIRQHLVEYIENIGVINNQFNKLRPQRRLNELQKFLNESRSGLHDQNWLLKARNILKQTCEPSIRACNENVFVDLIQQIRLTIPNIKNLYVWPEHDKNLPELFTEDYHGISLIIRFGKENKILPNPVNHEDNLALLLRQVYSFLNVKRDRFEGFDWFVGTIFLICAGNIEKIKIVLQCLINFPIALYIWPTFGTQVGRNKNFNFYIHFDHSLNLLVGDLEIFKPALENASISWNFIVRNWINQCFFNVLEWNEICNFIVVCILYPIDYVLFFFICCAQHLEPKILTAITSNDINRYQNLQYLGGLHISNCFDSLEQLSKQYKNILASRVGRRVAHVCTGCACAALRCEEKSRSCTFTRGQFLVSSGRDRVN